MRMLLIYSLFFSMQRLERYYQPEGIPVLVMCIYQKTMYVVKSKKQTTKSN